MLAGEVDWLLENIRSGVIKYIGFKAALVSVSHEYLIHSLRSFEIPEIKVRAVKFMQDSATMMLRLQSQGGQRLHSQRVAVIGGVLQGGILSPFCFIT